MNSIKIKVNEFSENLIKTSLIVLLFGFIITQLFELKIHYFIFILSSCIIAIININKYEIIQLKKAFYIVITALLCIITVPRTGFSAAFLFSLVSYLMVPIIFYSKGFKNFKISSLSTVFKIANVFFAFGLILQYLGAESRFLDSAFTYTSGNLESRFGSFAGGSLLLGLCGCFQILFSVIELSKDQKSNIKQKIEIYFFLSVAVFNLICSQSRRFYIFILLTLLIVYLFRLGKINKQRIIKAILFFSIFCILFFVLSFTVLEKNYFVIRLFSVFDFKNDNSNNLRIFLWLKAINDFLNNFWIGTGLSSTTIVGKDIWNVVDNIEDIITTESFFLKNFVEGGIIFGSFWFFLLANALKKAFKAFKENSNLNEIAAGYFIVFFFIDSFVSTSLESILSSTIFWICLSILDNKQRLTLKEI
jgi:hypothetical protein